MNTIFKIKQNALGQSIVTSELAKNKGKTASLLLSTLLGFSAFSVATPISVQGLATSENAVSIGSNSYATAVDGIATGQGAIATGQGFSRENFAEKANQLKSLSENKDNTQKELDEINTKLEVNEKVKENLSKQVDDLSELIDSKDQKSKQLDKLNELLDLKNDELAEQQESLDKINKLIPSEYLIGENKNISVDFTPILNSLDYNKLNEPNGRNTLAQELKTKLETDFSDIQGMFTDKQYLDVLNEFISKRSSYDAFRNVYDAEMGNTKYKNVSVDTINTGEALENVYLRHGKSITLSKIDDIYLRLENDKGNHTYSNYHTNNDLSRKEYSAEYWKNYSGMLNNLYDQLIVSYLAADNSSNTSFIANQYTNGGCNAWGGRADCDNRALNYVFRLAPLNATYNENNKFKFLSKDTSSEYIDNVQTSGIRAVVHRIVNDKALSNNDLDYIQHYYEQFELYANNIDYDSNKWVVDKEHYRNNLQTVLNFNAKLEEYRQLSVQIREEASNDNVRDSLLAQQINLKKEIEALNINSSYFDSMPVSFNDVGKTEVQKGVDYIIQQENFIDKNLRYYDGKNVIITNVQEKIKDIQEQVSDAEKAIKNKQREIDQINNQIKDLALTPDEKAAVDLKAEKEKELADKQTEKEQLEADKKEKEDELNKLNEQLANSSLKDLGLHSQAHGSESFASGDDSIAMGTRSTVTANDGIAIGRETLVTGKQSIAIGAESVVTGDKSIAIGVGHTVSGNSSTTIGDPNVVTGDNSFVAGNNNQIHGSQSLVVGNYVNIYDESSRDNVLLGNTVNLLSGNENVIISAFNGDVVGSSNTIVGSHIGGDTNGSTLMGYLVTSYSNNVTAIGNNITVNDGFDNSVVLGASSEVATANPTTSIKIQDVTYHFAGVTPSSTVSVGAVGQERQIVNVAAGRISDTSTDAINGSQLYSAIEAINSIKPSISITAGDNIKIDGKDNDFTISAIDTNTQSVTKAGQGVTVDVADNAIGTKDYTVSIKATDGLTFDDAGNLKVSDTLVKAGDNVVVTGNAKDGFTVSSTDTNTQSSSDVVDGKGLAVTKTQNANGTTHYTFETKIGAGLTFGQNGEIEATGTPINAGKNITVTGDAINGYTISAKGEITEEQLQEVINQVNGIVDTNTQSVTKAGQGVTVDVADNAIGTKDYTVSIKAADGLAFDDAGNLKVSDTLVKAGDNVVVTGNAKDGFTVSSNLTEVNAGDNIIISGDAKTGYTINAENMRTTVTAGNGTEVDSNDNADGSKNYTVSAKIGGGLAFDELGRIINNIAINAGDNVQVTGNGVDGFTISATDTNTQATVSAESGITVTESDNANGTKNYAVAAKLGKGLKIDDNGAIAATAQPIKGGAGVTVSVDAEEVQTVNVVGVTTTTDDGKSHTRSDLTKSVGVKGDRKNIHTTTTANGDVQVNMSDDIHVNSVSIHNGPNITQDGINANNTRITNVQDGVAPTDAVNVRQLNQQGNVLNQRIDNLANSVKKNKKRTDAGIAATAAMSNIPQVMLPGKSGIGVGVGNRSGQTAVAVGYSRVSDDSKHIIKLSAGVDTQSKTTFGAGYMYQW